MFPWLWFWSPQFYFPFSGSVRQRIEPVTDLFFDGIRPEAGNGALEQKIFETASYGRQIGWLTDVLLGTQSSDPAMQDQGAEALVRLRETRNKIEALKQANSAALADAAAGALDKLRAADPAGYERLLAAALRAAAPQTLLIAGKPAG